MRTRLLMLFVALAGVFAATWYFVRDNPRQAPLPPPKVKTTAELLIGMWKIIEQEDPPLPPNITATSEFTDDGKKVLRLTESRRGPLSTMTSIYQLQGDEIRFDYDDGTGGPRHTWKARIETITDDALILVGTEGKPRRVVYERQLGN